jgi:hypothetical protein
MVFMLQFESLLVLQTSSNSLKYKYGFSRSKPWKEGKSWIMSGLKLKWDASGGNYAWGCTCSCGIHVVSQCSNMIILIILIMKWLIILFSHVFWKWWGFPKKSTT